MDDVYQPESPQSPSPGAALAAARTLQGLSVEQVAGKLKLAVFQIRAIEADNHGALPGDVFARGFIRNYARLLKLDAEPLMAALARQNALKHPQPDSRLLHDAKTMGKGRGVVMVPAHHRRLPLTTIAIITVCVVGALAFYEFALNEPNSAAPVAQPAAQSVTQGQPTPAPAAAGGEVVSSPVPVPAPLSMLTVEAALRDDLQKQASETALRNGGLHFLFSKESWVEVRDGLGNILFSKINNPGTEHRVVGDPPFSVVVGNAQGVRLAYKGNPVDLAAHATADVARLRLE